MPGASADIEDVLLAQRLASEAVPLITAGYLELVFALRSDESAVAAAERARPDIQAGDSAHIRNKAYHLLFDEILLGSTLDAYKKKRGELVSKGERDAGSFIRSVLERERPADSHKGEETGLFLGETDRCWFDDPVDGTTAMLKAAIIDAFVLDYPDAAPAFGIAIGLVEDGVAIVGVVGELRSTRRSQNADQVGLQLANLYVGQVASNQYTTTINGRLERPHVFDSHRASVVTTAPERMFRTGNGQRDYIKEAGLEALLSEFGQSCPVVDQNIVGILSTARGSAVAYERDLTAEDIAAAGPILAGLGVSATDVQGQVLRFDDLGAEYTLVAAAPPLANRAVRLICDAHQQAEREMRANPDALSRHPYFDKLYDGTVSAGYVQKFGSGS